MISKACLVYRSYDWVKRFLGKFLVAITQLHMHKYIPVRMCIWGDSSTRTQELRREADRDLCLGLSTRYIVHGLLVSFVALVNIININTNACHINTYEIRMVIDYNTQCLSQINQREYCLKWNRFSQWGSSVQLCEADTFATKLLLILELQLDLIWLSS